VVLAGAEWRVRTSRRGYPEPGDKMEPDYSAERDAHVRFT
jgi:hypothetical protein